MKKRRARDGMRLLEIAESALHHVRLAPIDALAPYYIGTLPFALCFLYFWADMIQSAFAYRHLHTSAMVVTAAYIWMKCWQSIYCAKLRANMTGVDTGAWTIARVVRIVATQAVIHSTAIVAVPVALVLTVPFPSVYGFYQNVTVFGADEDNGVRAVSSRAWAEAKRWPKQNLQLIWMFSPMPLVIGAGLILVMVPVSAALRSDYSESMIVQFVTLYSIILVILSPIGILLAFNVGIAIVMVPSILKSILGIETTVSMGGDFFNSTFFAICVAIAAMCLDPVLKAAYSLRCFHGESLQSGADLRIALRRIAASRGLRLGALIAVAFAASLTCGPTALAQAESTVPLAVRADELDHAISIELEGSEYVWRTPREIPSEAFQENFLTRFLQSVRSTIWDGLKSFGRWVQRTWEKLFSGRDGVGGASSVGSGGGWVAMQQALWFMVFGALLAALGYFAYRVYKQRSTDIVHAVATATPATPNLEEDDVTADALPEEGWLNLARDLAERGDLRLAMRALFLASLSVLAHRDMIRIAKYKSNREYGRELERIIHAVPDVPPIFAKSVRALERVWYGNHEVDRLSFGAYSIDQERIRSLAKQH
ncbi:MAG: hypothetical protein IT366_06225 [Candidatus Hydrogenedentes bacterium]|nr:hypothetical protein [Candidatus Hydrogenedentota bacterium]